MPAPPRQRTLLIVDDEDMLRAVLVEYFRDRGYVVMDAADALTAFGLVERGGVDLVLSDLRLGARYGGLELARDIRKENPGLPVILMSGAPDHEGENPVAEGFEVVPKPFPLPEMAERIAAVLALRS